MKRQVSYSSLIGGGYSVVSLHELKENLYRNGKSVSQEGLLCFLSPVHKAEYWNQNSSIWTGDSDY